MFSFEYRGCVLVLLSDASVGSTVDYLCNEPHRVLDNLCNQNLKSTKRLEVSENYELEGKN